jgi:hypothetical protein
LMQCKIELIILAKIKKQSTIVNHLDTVAKHSQHHY